MTIPDEHTPDELEQLRKEAMRAAIQRTRDHLAELRRDARDSISFRESQPEDAA